MWQLLQLFVLDIEILLLIMSVSVYLCFNTIPVLHSVTFSSLFACLFPCNSLFDRQIGYDGLQGDKNDDEKVSCFGG